MAQEYKPQPTLTEGQRERGEYMVAIAGEEHNLNSEQVRAMSDVELQDWLFANVDTYLVGGGWVETCAWCGGTGSKHGGYACDGCNGDGFREALDELD